MCFEPGSSCHLFLILCAYDSLSVCFAEAPLEEVQPGSQASPSQRRAATPRKLESLYGGAAPRSAAKRRRSLAR